MSGHPGAGRRDARHRERERARAARRFREALDIEALVTGHCTQPMATRHAERACRRNDEALGRTREHDAVKDHMSTTFTATSNLLEPGQYGLELVRVGDVESREYGQTIKLTFKHTAGTLAGSEWEKSFKASMKEGATLRTIVEGFLGRELAPGEPVDLERFIGWKALVAIGKDRTNTGNVYNTFAAFIQIRRPPGATTDPMVARAAPSGSALDELEGPDAPLDDVPF